MSNLPYFTLVRQMAGQPLTTAPLESKMDYPDETYAHDLSDGYQTDESEESYRQYQRSLRYKLDVYLEAIDPWLIPIQRLCLIGVSLHFIFS
jgi:hypothetical protein